LNKTGKLLRRNTAFCENGANLLPGWTLKWLASLILRQAKRLTDEHDGSLPETGDDGPWLDTFTAHAGVDALSVEDAFALSTSTKVSIELLKRIHASLQDCAMRPNNVLCRNILHSTFQGALCRIGPLTGREPFAEPSRAD
jgi:hypothetical protein